MNADADRYQRLTQNATAIAGPLRNAVSRIYSTLFQGATEPRDLVELTESNMQPYMAAVEARLSEVLAQILVKRANSKKPQTGYQPVPHLIFGANASGRRAVTPRSGGDTARRTGSARRGGGQAGQGGGCYQSSGSRSRASSRRDGDSVSTRSSNIPTPQRVSTHPGPQELVFGPIEPHALQPHSAVSAPVLPAVANVDRVASRVDGYAAKLMSSAVRTNFGHDAATS